MPILTLPSTPLPDDEPDLNSDIKLYKAEFAGYSQRIGAGINNVTRTITLTWSNILVSEANTLDAFCVAHSGGQVFYWTPVGMSQMKWSLSKYRRKIRGAGFAAFSMDLRQEYDP